MSFPCDGLARLPGEGVATNADGAPWPCLGGATTGRTLQHMSSGCGRRVGELGPAGNRARVHMAIQGRFFFGRIHRPQID